MESGQPTGSYACKRKNASPEEYELVQKRERLLLGSLQTSERAGKGEVRAARATQAGPSQTILPS